LWKYQISLKTAESSSSTHGRRVIERAEQILVSRPGKIWEGEGRMSEVNLEFLLKVMPPGEAKLYRVLIQLIPAPSAEAPNLARRQIKMEVLAKLTGFTKRWVIELLPRLEERNLIRTEGGSGTVKWIWRLPLGVPRLGPTQLTQKRTTSPGKAKAPRVAAPQPKRRQETAPSPKTGADVNVAPPVEKPAEIPERRQEVPMPSIPPADPAAPDNPVVLATMAIPPPLPAPADPVVPAARVTPPPSAVPGGPAASDPVASLATVAPPSAASGAPAASSPMRAAKVVLPPLATPGGPAPDNPAVTVTPPSSTAPAIPAKPIPPAPPPMAGAPIKDLVAYVCSQPVTPDLIGSLYAPAGNGQRLRYALHILCQRRRRYAQESDLKGAIRSVLNE
jgi:hypothetical protein